MHPRGVEARRSICSESHPRSSRCTLVGLKLAVVMTGPHSPSFQMHPRGVEASTLSATTTAGCVFQMHPRGVEAGGVHVLQRGLRRSRCTLVGLKRADQGRGGGRRRGSRCTLVGLKRVQPGPGVVGRRRSRCTLVGLKRNTSVRQGLKMTRFQMHPRGVEAAYRGGCRRRRGTVPDAPSWG